MGGRYLRAVTEPNRVYLRHHGAVLLFTLPMALIGIFFGDRLHTGMSDIAFGRFVSVSLIISGFALLVTA